jgi:hypothetical protein
LRFVVSGPRINRRSRQPSGANCGAAFLELDVKLGVSAACIAGLNGDEDAQWITAEVLRPPRQPAKAVNDFLRNCAGLRIGVCIARAVHPVARKLGEAWRVKISVAESGCAQRPRPGQISEKHRVLARVSVVVVMCQRRGVNTNPGHNLAGVEPVPAVPVTRRETNVVGAAQTKVNLGSRHALRCRLRSR